MKRKVIQIAGVVLSILAFISSSPWEGAAAMAPDGELPETGMFVATNSFPVNTVVDITNLETGKSARAIVAKGLDSPGLLAVVSREACAVIGMRQGSISRLRMAQPSDPIAYLRFIEGQAEGIPSYDSGNVLTEESFREKLAASSAALAAESSAPEPAARAPSGATGPSYILEEEWRNRGEEIVTLDRYSEPAYEEEPFIYPPAEDHLYFAEDYEEEDEYGDYYGGYLVEYDDLEYDYYDLYDEYEEIAEAEYAYWEEEDEYGDYYDGYLVEYDDLEYDEYDLLEDEYIAEEEIIEEEPAYIAEADPIEEEIIEEETEYVLVPAEERPPEPFYGIDLNELFPPITAAVPEEEPRRANELTASFSVPRVTSLDRGKYYVQIASYDSPELVEYTLSEIGLTYKPLVYIDADALRYRVLLGPMNQGESAAVLARFKSIGYKDAFVRQAR